MSFMCGSKIILQGGGKGGVHWDNLVFGTRTEGGGVGVRSLFSVILFYYVNLISFIFRDESGTPPPPPTFSFFNLRMRFGDSNCSTDRLIFLIF